jgi:hypothetical protein
MYKLQAFARLAGAATIAALLAACGGGGGGSSAIPSGALVTQPSPSTQPAGGNTQASMVINIPAKSATQSVNRKNPKYISASTQSMTISTVSGGKATQIAEADLTPSSKGCAVVTGGVTQCTVSFLANAGSDTFQLNMYDQTGGKGNLLSTGDVNATITAGQNNTVAVSLDGVPASLSIVLGQSSLQVGTAASTSVYVQARDADNNIIVGPGGFSSPISLAVTGDTYSTLTLAYPSPAPSQSPSSNVTSPGEVVTLNYTGGTNIGSTITASTTGATSAAASFAGSGAAVTLMPMNLLINGSAADAYPENVAGYADGSGAAASYYFNTSCCPEPAALATVSTGGSIQLFVGAGSPYAGDTGVTTVTGMSSNIEQWGGYEGDSTDMLAVDANKNIYYSAENSSNCYVLGKLNPSAGTSSETVLQGEMMFPHFDTSGNLWFIEESGACSSSTGTGFTSGWGIGEVSAGGALTERDLGISGLNPEDMGITSDGASMIVAQYGTNLYKISTSALSNTSLTMNHSDEPYAMAVDPSGNAVWAGDNWANYNMWYGTTTASFSAVTEAQFPVPYVADVYGITYGDGSFWMGTDYCGGIGRLSGVASGATVAGYYPTTYGDGEQPCFDGVSNAGGVLWAADDSYGVIAMYQYGAASNGSMAVNKVRRTGTQSEPKNPHPRKIQSKQRTPN